MFFELQTSQITKWLLNPYMYAVVAALTLLSMAIGAERLDRRYWNETGNDFAYGVLYAALYFPIIAICLEWSNWFLDSYIPWLRLELIKDAPGWVKFLIIVLLDDFLAYWSHRLRHQVKFLWHFHTIHHSQERLNPFTTKRFHPLENLFHKIVILLIPMAIVGGSLEMWYLYFLLDAVWDYFIHSNVRMTLGPLRHVVVTPQYHRIHHSMEKEHFDQNYSDRFVIWDHLFGTAYTNCEVYPATGVAGYPSGRSDSLMPMNFLRAHLLDLAYPFRMIASDIRSRRARVKPTKGS